MKTLEWFTKLLKEKTSSILYYMLPPEQTRLSSEKPTDNTELKAGEHYFRLLLVEMFLANDRRWLTDWFPVVHAAVNFKFGDQRELLTHVAGESFLSLLGRQNPGRIAGLNYPLTPLLPFNGGTIELDAGLIAVAGGNDVLAGLQILESFSQLLVVPQLSAALAVAMPLADGVSKFIGATENQMLLGLHQSWASEAGGANILRAGYFIVIAADDKIKQQNLFVVDDGLRYGATLESAAPLADYDYMLFRIESRTERDDWDSLSAIQKPYERAIEMLQAGNTEMATAYIRTAKAAAFTAKELTSKVDRRRVTEQLDKAYNEAQSLFGPVMRGSRAFPDSKDTKLSDLMKDAESPADAARRGILLPDIIGLRGISNHSLKSAEKHASYIKNYGTRSGSKNLDTAAFESSEAEDKEKEQFFFALKGDHAKGNTVQKDSIVDLLFDFGLPKGNAVLFVQGDKLERVIRTDATLGLMVSPRGFNFTDEKESGYRQIKIKNGEFADGAVSFQLKAFDAESYEKAFADSKTELAEIAAENYESPIYSTGFHIAFDVESIQIYRFFLPVELADDIGETDEMIQPLSFNLDLLDQSTEYVTKSRRNLKEIVTNILAAKEVW